VSRTPTCAMAIMAHPDDAEFTIAGTVAKWAHEGARIVYVLCTDGNVGSQEPGMTTENVAQIRRAEQRAACDVLGVDTVVFLGHGDGQLEPSLALRRELVALLRQYQPEIVIASDPTRLFVEHRYVNHPDHRAAAMAALDAVAPACAMPLLWPELGAPHRVHKLYISSHSEPDTFVDISGTIELKIDALKRHASQMGDWDPGERIRDWAASVGKPHGLAYAEAFYVIALERDEEDTDTSSADES